MTRTKKTHFLSFREVQEIRRDLRTASTQREVARKWGLSDWYISQLKHYQRRPHAI